MQLKLKKINIRWIIIKFEKHNVLVTSSWYLHQPMDIHAADVCDTDMSILEKHLAADDPGTIIVLIFQVALPLQHQLRAHF